MTLRFADFQRIVFFTGAGISAESGVPTYRGAGGIWKEYDYEEYACQTAFKRNPDAVWEFHNYRRGLVGACEPNDGHRLIAKLEAEHPNVTVVTQNIDGLHHLAGSKKVLELHGSLWKLHCEECGATDEIHGQLDNVHCDCGAYWRPSITWFGDALNAQVFQDAAEALSRADLCVAIGTSGVVYPAAGLPELAQRAGATMVEVNPEETAISGMFTHHLRGPASQMLPQLT